MPQRNAIKHIICFLLIIGFFNTLFCQNLSLSINLRGVYETSVEITPLSGIQVQKPIVSINVIKSNEKSVIHIPAEYLPGEFVLRFDYKSKPEDSPYPAEMRLLLSDQDLELYVNPIYAGNNDSTWFQNDEIDNTRYAFFLQESAEKMSMLNLLQNFLLQYDDNKSSLYKNGINEYEKRRKTYNNWLNDLKNIYTNNFVSSLFGFHYIPRIHWGGTDLERKESLRENYFDGQNLTNPMILKSAGMKLWMDRYVNLYGELATTIEIRDSLFAYAGKRAIEISRKGHPEVYGWMVDYFFDGYERFNIQSGTKMLEPYLNDPNCHTSKRKAINMRLAGMKEIVTGVLPPNISLPDHKNGLFDLYSYESDKQFLLLLFWSADCNHCNEITDELYSAYQKTEFSDQLDIITISLDETEDELLKWQHKKDELNGWIHLRTEEGIRSKVANDYYILGIPVLIILDAKSKKIISLPENIGDIMGMWIDI